jgi:hypothetical protein
MGKVGNPNWKKGKSANPKTQFKPGDAPRKGMKNTPKLPDLKTVLAEVLGEEVVPGIPALTIILKALRAKAAKGDVKATALILDRAYGKAVQFIEQVNKNQIDLTTLSEEELFLIEKIQSHVKKDGADNTDSVS